METYFNIRYEMDKDAVRQVIDRYISEQSTTYICVADGVILNIVNRNPEYLKIVNGGAFSICDSSYVPIYLKWIYGINREQYCGSQIFMDLVKMKKYRIIKQIEYGMPYTLGEFDTFHKCYMFFLKVIKREEENVKNLSSSGYYVVNDFFENK